MLNASAIYYANKIKLFYFNKINICCGRTSDMTTNSLGQTRDSRTSITKKIKTGVDHAGNDSIKNQA